MKKVLLGCLGVLVILAIGAGVASYFAYRSAKSYLSSFSQLQEIPKLNEQVRNKASFTPPGNGELTEDQVTRFIAVQKTIKDKLGARVKELDSHYKTLGKGQGNQVSFSEGLSALKDLGGLVVEAKKVQVDALNEHNFSLAEYDWTRKAAYLAAGVPLSMNFEEALRKAQSGNATAESMTEAAVGEAPEKNKQLIAPYAESLRESAGLAFFGL